MGSGAEVFCGREKFSVDAREIAAVLDFLRGNAPWDFPEGTLSVAFLGDDEICRMHGEFLADFSKTDVITFPGDEIFSVPRERAIGNAVPAPKAKGASPFANPRSRKAGASRSNAALVPEDARNRFRDGLHRRQDGRGVVIGTMCGRTASNG